MAVVRAWWRRFLERRQARRQEWIERQATKQRDVPDARAERWKALGGGMR
jgi:hypothetical protein